MQLRDQQTAEGILFTDQYQLSMAQLYYRLGLHEKQVQFDHYFRSYPDYGLHQAGYCINAGLEWLVSSGRLGAPSCPGVKMTWPIMICCPISFHCEALVLRRSNNQASCSAPSSWRCGS